MPTHHRRLICWIALLAMWAMALFPTVSHALAAQRGADLWTEICTPQGMRQVALPEEGQADPASSPVQAAGHLKHCLFCLTHSVGLGMPPVGLQVLAPVVTTAAVPRPTLQAPPAHDAGCNAQARAPPTHS